MQPRHSPFLREDQLVVRRRSEASVSRRNGAGRYHHILLFVFVVRRSSETKGEAKVEGEGEGGFSLPVSYLSLATPSTIILKTPSRCIS